MSQAIQKIESQLGRPLINYGNMPEGLAERINQADIKTQTQRLGMRIYMAKYMDVRLDSRTTSVIKQYLVDEVGLWAAIETDLGIKRELRMSKEEAYTISGKIASFYGSLTSVDIQMAFLLYSTNQFASIGEDPKYRPAEISFNFISRILTAYLQTRHKYVSTFEDALPAKEEDATMLDRVGSAYMAAAIQAAILYQNFWTVATRSKQIDQGATTNGYRDTYLSKVAEIANLFDIEIDAAQLLRMISFEIAALRIASFGLPDSTTSTLLEIVKQERDYMEGLSAGKPAFYSYSLASFEKANAATLPLAYQTLKEATGMQVNEDQQAMILSYVNQGKDHIQTATLADAHFSKGTQKTYVARCLRMAAMVMFETCMDDLMIHPDHLANMLDVSLDWDRSMEDHHAKILTTLARTPYTPDKDDPRGSWITQATAATGEDLLTIYHALFCKYGI